MLYYIYCYVLLSVIAHSGTTVTQEGTRLLESTWLIMLLKELMFHDEVI